ncbi:MAG: Hsp33 family molecular chaperone HslO [Eubacteriales bacterium]|nr:Hsp33 family molecular chaperone HslO [Eubacteriales bacterium]
MDKLVRGQSMDGAIRVFAAVTTDLSERARQIHQSMPVAAAALGRTLTVAAMMGAQLKNETDTVTIQFAGDGPLGKIVAVTDSSSKVRGYVENPFADLPLNRKGKIDVGGGVGKGRLSIVRDLGMKEPYVGQVPIVTGEIAEDITYYYAKSEQIPTAVGLGVLVDTDYSIKASGGFLIQLMPFATDETAAKLEEQVRKLPSVTEMITSGMTAEDMLFKVCDGFSMMMDNNAVTPAYECKCSKERMERALISIGKTELEKIISENGEAELTCQFCDRKYKFDIDQLENMLKQAK